MKSLSDYNQFLPWENDLNLPIEEVGPDDRSGSVYLHDPKLQLAAEIAIVTQRPLLIRGDPGSGKSSFAPFAARNLKWSYYQTTITGRTEAKDLLWKFDAIARLRDAQAQSAITDIAPSRYITPGILWWAFNRDDAANFVSNQNATSKPRNPAQSHECESLVRISNQRRDPFRAVVLIDEIDKAEPELPNDLLEVLGLNRFVVDELNRSVERKVPDHDPSPSSPNHYGSLLIIITTNQERDLPAAFIRRCIVHTIEEPTNEEEQIKRLKEIAYLHMRGLISSHKVGDELVEVVAEVCCELRQEAKERLGRGPSTAEFLDALRVCFILGIDPDPESELWQYVKQNVFIKEARDLG
jgi:MoxR-like ATPase